MGKRNVEALRAKLRVQTMLDGWMPLLDPADTRAACLMERAGEVERRHMGLFGNCARLLSSPLRTDAEVRTRGIGEGQVRARARMERFRAWLSEQPIAHEVAARHARDAVSPEHAVRRAAALGFGWPFVAVGSLWHERLKYEITTGEEGEALADDLLGLGKHVERGPSPEWRGLSWQVENRR